MQRLWRIGWMSRWKSIIPVAAGGSLSATRSASSDMAATKDDKTNKTTARRGMRIKSDFAGLAMFVCGKHLGVPRHYGRIRRSRTLILSSIRTRTSAAAANLAARLLIEGKVAVREMRGATKNAD